LRLTQGTSSRSARRSRASARAAAGCSGDVSILGPRKVRGALVPNISSGDNRLHRDLYLAPVYCGRKPPLAYALSISVKAFEREAKENSATVVGNEGSERFSYESVLAATTSSKSSTPALSLWACRRIGSSGSDRWPHDTLVLAVYPVDNFDLRRAVTDHHYRFYAVPSFIEFVGATYRLVPVIGPSCIVPFGTARRMGFLVDAVNAQATPVVGLWPTVPSGPLPVRRDRKETFATTMINAGEVEVKCPRHGEGAPDRSSHDAAGGMRQRGRVAMEGGRRTLSPSATPAVCLQQGGYRDSVKRSVRRTACVTV
jgi:hypothetical protein